MHPHGIQLNLPSERETKRNTYDTSYRWCTLRQDCKPFAPHSCRFLLCGLHSPHIYVRMIHRVRTNVIGACAFQLYRAFTVSDSWINCRSNRCSVRERTTTLSSWIPLKRYSFYIWLGSFFISSRCCCAYQFVRLLPHCKQWIKIYLSWNTNQFTSKQSVWF